MDLEQLKPLITWLHLHPHWAGAVAFLIAFTESLALVGLIVPGTVIMTAVGALMGANVIPILSTLVWAATGCIIADCLSYWLGYRYKENIREMWPFSRYPQWLEKGEAFFHRHGGKSVFLGRFVGPVRPIIPLIAGMMKMDLRRFLTADVISGIGWAPAYTLPGMLVGAASLQLGPEMATRFLIAIVTVLVILWLTTWLIKAVIAKSIQLLNNVLRYFWYWLGKHKKVTALYYLLTDPVRPRSHTQLTLAVAFLVCAIGFLLTLHSIVHHGYITALNEPINHLFLTLRNHAVDQIIVPITLLADAQGLFLISVGMIAWLCWRRHWYAALHLSAVFLLSFGCGYVLKHLVSYPRPPGLTIIRNTASFPSGHTTLSISILGFLTVLAVRNYTKTKRRLFYGVTTFIISTIIVSRLYLGAHWLSDIIGSILLGLSLLFLTIVSFRRQRISERVANRNLSIDTLKGLLVLLPVVWSGIIFSRFTQQLYAYTPYWPTQTISRNTWWQQAKPIKPLLYRNHFGIITQTYNVQWLGKISHIEKNLAQQGWTRPKRMTLRSSISHFTNMTAYELPLLPQLYQNQEPALILSKSLGKHKFPIVLRLWHANVKFKNNHTNLWIGSIDYYQPLHFFMPHRKQAKLTQHGGDSSTLLLPYLKSYQHKNVAIKSNIRIWGKEVKQVVVLLIRK